MWAEAAKWLNKFDEAVLTVLDSDGYPASVRVDPRAYDSARGELPSARCPTRVRAVEGPANLMCHYHDEKMWKLSAILIKGRVENRDGAWVFVSTAFSPPSKLRCSHSSREYGSRPRSTSTSEVSNVQTVNWAAVKEIQRRVKANNS